jgi:large subunit ribosomal protein L29
LAERKPAPSRKQGARRGRKKAADPVADLAVRLRELNEELFRLRFQFATRQLTNTSRIRVVRRDIARAKTLQRQQELAASRQPLAAGGSAASG